jgi:hypothetical protein
MKAKLKGRNNREKFDDLVHKVMVKSYEEYLIKSEDTTTSDIREDAFLSGFYKGMDLMSTLVTEMDNFREGKNDKQ